MRTKGPKESVRSSKRNHQQLNRDAWSMKAEEYADPAELKWDSPDPVWGIWQIPNERIAMLPESLKGKRCLEIGCGTAYVASWMAMRGGETYAIDPTRNQLNTAARLRNEHDRHVVLLEAFGEQLPFPDESFDFAISEYGASLWADPYQWVPEAARVLKPSAQLVFMTCHPISQLCCPEQPDLRNGTELLRPYLGMYELHWSDPPTVEFQLPHGKWIELLRSCGFEIEELHELGAPPDGKSQYVWADADWAQSWPTEEVWVVRKTGN